MLRMVAPQPACMDFRSCFQNHSLITSRPYYLPNFWAPLMIYEGAPAHQIEVIDELNRSASIRLTDYNGSAKSSEKKGDVPQDDIRELTDLVSALRAFLRLTRSEY
ncbi:hypothetical protein FB567DRAFT_498595 [Paraphoma chrysanthemicola]|uniref:Uncharacterized protein n=1 Tax=Paraphoma chrysanthemicola TaxID=798071 RepID=A0A8K0VY54_9PLEO|nr:hypothetical protein FB567DRAFT_498595 [Paraphoma chrysanthemicola]